MAVRQATKPGASGSGGLLQAFEDPILPGTLGCDQSGLNSARDGSSGSWVRDKFDDIYSSRRSGQHGILYKNGHCSWHCRGLSRNRLGPGQPLNFQLEQLLRGAPDGLQFVKRIGLTRKVVITDNNGFFELENQSLELVGIGFRDAALVELFPQHTSSSSAESLRTSTLPGIAGKRYTVLPRRHWPYYVTTLFRQVS